MLTVGIGALQIVLDKGSRKTGSNHADHDPRGAERRDAGRARVHELTTDDPIVDLRVLKARSYAVGVFLMTVVGFVLYGSMVLLAGHAADGARVSAAAGRHRDGAARHRIVFMMR